ncbi:MAG: hypothetical protein EPN88_14845, partial [Bacteroidetes bacterium]
MNLFKKILLVISTRPFYLFKYSFETILFSINFIIWKIIAGKQVKIGKNLHVLTTTCFQGEKPNGRIEVGNNFVAYYNCKIRAWDKGIIKIGNNCSFGSGTKIDSRRAVSIGNYVLTSWDVLISDFDGHPIDPEERAVEME